MTGRAVALVLTLLCARGAHATSGYLRGPGSGYAKLSYWQMASHTYFTLDGTRRDSGQRLTQRGLVLFAEYGLIEHLAIAANIPLLRANSYSETSTALGIGDVTLELKTGVTLGAWHIALAVAPDLPTGRSLAFVSDNNGGRINLPTGDGELNVWTRVALARAIEPLNAYASADVGYNVRTEGFSDQLGFSFELGHLAFDHLWIIGRTRGQFSLSDDPNPAVPFLYGEGTEFIALDASLAVPIGPVLTIGLDYSNVAFARRNIYGGSFFGGGMSAQW